MSFLIDRYHIPPGGWRYTQPETTTEIRGGDFFNLCQQVRTHRELNKLPTIDLEKQVEEQICANLKVEARMLYCRQEEAVKRQFLKSVEFADVKHFLRTIMNIRRFVPQSEAERRAGICAQCPLNYPIAGCTRCRNLPGLIFKILGRRRTKVDLALRGCGVCGCSLAASVHVPLNAFPLEPRYQFPDWCWHRTS